MKTKIETEAKIKLSQNSFKKTIKNLGKPKFIKQRNDFFMDSSGKIVRLRYENDAVILNRKIDINLPSDFKSKKEEEISPSGNDLGEILVFLGFRKFFSYTKERANFDRNKCIISLDKLSGNQYYIEIEGEEDNIKEVISKSSLKEKHLEKRSYLEILGGVKCLKK